jgi:hypothetical protein
MLEKDDLASIRAGGFVGFAGAALVWRAGIVGRDRMLEQEGEADKAPEQHPSRPEPRRGPTDSW